MKTYLINPVSKPRMTQSDKWKKRKATSNYWVYKDLLRWEKVEVPTPCHVIFNISMPHTWSNKKRKSMDGKPHEQKPDIDNLLKGLFDAIFEEDCHIYKILAEKNWAEVGSISIGSL